MKVKIFSWLRKYSELLFIAVGLLISALYIWGGVVFDAHTFAYEKLGKVVFGIAMYFIVEGVCRLHFIGQYRKLYNYFDSSFKENEKWEILEEKHRPWFALLLYVGRLLAMAILISAL